MQRGSSATKKVPGMLQFPRKEEGKGERRKEEKGKEGGKKEREREG